MRVERAPGFPNPSWALASLCVFWGRLGACLTVRAEGP